MWSTTHVSWTPIEEPKNHLSFLSKLLPRVPINQEIKTKAQKRDYALAASLVQYSPMFFNQRNSTTDNRSKFFTANTAPDRWLFFLVRFFRLRSANPLIVLESVSKLKFLRVHIIWWVEIMRTFFKATNTWIYQINIYIYILWRLNKNPHGINISKNQL